MGAWGTGLFDDDGTCDLAMEVQEAKSIAPTLLIAAEHELTADDGQPYLEVDSGEGIIVAAVVALEKLGRLPANLRAELPQDLADSIPEIEMPDEKQMAQIQRGISLLLDPDRSELYQFWEEADPEDFRQWRERVEALRAAMPQ